jgi:hypothetical protein
VVHYITRLHLHHQMLSHGENFFVYILALAAPIFFFLLVILVLQKYDFNIIIILHACLK